MKKNIFIALILVATVGAVYGFLRLTLQDRTISPPGVGQISGPVPSDPQTRQMDLFFADVTGRRLSLERREVTGDNRDDLLKQAVEELIKGPMDDDRISIRKPNIKLSGTTIAAIIT